MFTFIFGVLIAVIGFAIAVLGKDVIPMRALRGVIFVGTALLGLVFVIVSSTLYVKTDEAGLVTKKFGADLKDGHIIAANGERGTQAGVLTPGWNFGYWPWNYDIEAVKNVDIAADMVGVVLAKDGKDLPAGEIYAPEWANPKDMVDGDKFMKEGYRGPQITVLPPAQYRFNPKLFTITPMPCLNVKIGEVAVIKANAGLTASNVVHVISHGTNNLPSDVQLVPKGYRGIWDTALLPNKYYLHPQAYEPITVKTIKRVYSYIGTFSGEATKGPSKISQHDNSISVRTKDSFSFPIDTRVTVIITAENAPFVVARFGNPDAKLDGEEFEALETRAILPSIRAILRNSAQDQNAIQFVTTRSEVEKDAYLKFKAEMEKDKVGVEALYLADIGLDKTPEGKQLLDTQTKKQIALQEIEQYKQMQLAETERANQEKAKALADLQKEIQESAIGIQVASNKADSATFEAKGKASAYDQQIKVLGGVDNLVKLELGKMAIETLAKAWKGEVPSTVISGGGENGLSSIMSGVFAQQLKTDASVVPVKVTPAGK